MKTISFMESKQLLALPIGAGLIDLAFQKGASDPLNPVKFWILGVLAAWCLACLFTNSRKGESVKGSTSNRILFIILGFLVSTFFVSFIFTDNKAIGFIGESGRNIGFLNYFFLSIISFYSARTLNIFNIKYIYYTIFFLSSFLAFYGTLQHFGKDFIKWVNQYNPIILFTGNPDFAGSLLGLFVVINFSALFLEFSKKLKYYLVFLDLYLLVLIYWTQARQGLVASAAGIGFFLVILTWKKNLRLGISLLCIELLVGLVSILGMLQIGPLAKYLFKASITDRGYDWRAALSMFKTHPLTGVGIDRYGAYFLQYRAAKYPLLFGYQVTVTNSHNVFLEIFSTAGIFAGTAYIAMICFVGFRGYVALRNTSGKEQFLVAGVISGWIVFIAQSTISVDSLALSIWGWIFGGAIVALSVVKTQEDSQSNFKGPMKSSWKFTDKSAGKRTLIFATSVTALLFIFVPMYDNETASFRFAQITPPVNTSQEAIYTSLAKRYFDQPLMNPSYKTNIALSIARIDARASIPYFQAVIREDSRQTNAYFLLALVHEQLKSFDAAIGLRKKLAQLDPYGVPNLLILEKDLFVSGDKAAARQVASSIQGMAPGTDSASQSKKMITG
jgi:O-antigen ligase